MQKNQHMLQQHLPPPIKHQSYHPITSEITFTYAFQTHTRNAYPFHVVCACQGIITAHCLSCSIGIGQLNHALIHFHWKALQ